MSDIISLQQFVGSKIKQFREEQKFTQEFIAQSLNTTRQTISRYESGERAANQDALFSLARILNKKVDDFFPSRNVGWKLYQHRLNNKLTLEGFADKYNQLFNDNITGILVSCWENNKVEPSLQIVKNISLMYSIPFNEFIEKVSPEVVLNKQKISEEKDRKDIGKRIEEIRKDLIHTDGLMFSGESLSEEALNSLTFALECIVQHTKKMNKKYSEEAE